MAAISGPPPIVALNLNLSEQISEPHRFFLLADGSRKSPIEVYQPQWFLRSSALRIPDRHLQGEVTEM
jgi:hypothetical protein